MSNPYTHPGTIWEHLTFPALSDAYDAGARDADHLGTLAFQIGLTEETLAAAAKHYFGTGEYMAWHRVAQIAEDAMQREMDRNRSGEFK